MSSEKQDPKDQFRSALEDLRTTAVRLSGHAKSTAELVELIDLALSNEAQLSILFTLVMQDPKAKGKIQ